MLGETSATLSIGPTPAAGPTYFTRGLQAKSSIIPTKQDIKNVNSGHNILQTQKRKTRQNILPSKVARGSPAREETKWPASPCIQQGRPLLQDGLVDPLHKGQQILVEILKPSRVKLPVEWDARLLVSASTLVARTLKKRSLNQRNTFESNSNSFFNILFKETQPVLPVIII